VIILGINAYHADSAAALIKDGVLIAAVEEERFRRVKHWAGFPSTAVDYCLREANVSFDSVDHVAVNQDSRANFFAKLRYLLTNTSSFGLALQRLRNRRQRESVPEVLERMFSKRSHSPAFHRVEHHLAHLSSAFHVSPFNEAVILSVDGFGDFASTAWGVGRGSDIIVNGRVIFPHSLGIFYQALTQYLGFPYYGDEYKVMGLAPYGSPEFMSEMRRLVKLRPGGGFELELSYFKHQKQDDAYQWGGGSPEFQDLFSSKMEELLGPRRQPNEPLQERHKNVARSTQSMYEEGFFHLLEGLQQSSGLTNIALAGGCAANSVANGKIRRRTGFEKVYVQAAAGDAGGAIGAAFAVWHRLDGKRNFVMDHAYWGPGYSKEELKGLLYNRQEEIERARCVVDEALNEELLCELVAPAIAEGKVVGWFQGRMEWGPRALGNRSILCDPRRGDMKAILNEKIKRRESFRPFAPSVLEEEVSTWFEEDDAVPFMMQVFQIRQEKRKFIPAVTHVDGSGRLQTVSRKTNPLFHRLIRAFERVTSIPMVLNTSFNENEPVVCAPEEALDCFLRTRMDLLVLDSFVVSRETSAQQDELYKY
jgi:carbamoyltransferase